jgi:hypothetical protein
LRVLDGSNRREADVADPGLGRLSWAESALAAAVSGRTEVGRKAVIPLRARNRLRRPHVDARKGVSWLNLIEGFFSKLTRSVLRNIRVASKQKLKDRLTAAVDHFNRHLLSTPGRTTLIELLL